MDLGQESAWREAEEIPRNARWSCYRYVAKDARIFTLLQKDVGRSMARK